MIAYLHGRILEKQPNRIVVDVAGVGYDVSVPLSTFYGLGEAGSEITLEYIEAERHSGHSPDLSQTGDMFERMVAFVGRHIKVDR